MPSAREYTEPYLAIYRPVPPLGPRVCDICHGAPGTGYLRCRSCFLTASSVTYPVEVVVPISLYRVQGQLHRVLSHYKSPWQTASRDRARLQIAATVARFLSNHGTCIRSRTGGDWDLITTVPSTRGRQGRHPLEDVLDMIPILRPKVTALLSQGPGQIGRRRSCDDGFVVLQDVRGTRVLLVDDTFTTSARMQSAASALRLAGADLAAAVVVGRVVNPDYNDESKALWETAEAQPFSFDVCCLE